MRSLGLPLLPCLLLAAACGDDDAPIDAAPTPDAPDVVDAAPPPDAVPSDAGSAVLPEEPGTPPPTGDPSVTLTTWNIGLVGTVKGAQERKPLIIDAIRAHAAIADVMCIQEAYLQFTSPPEMASELSDVFPYAFWTHTGETGLGNGLVILSKHPLFRGRELRFVAQDPNAFVDRMVIAANVLTADSYFTVLCTHLQAGLTGEPLTVKMEEIQETLAWAQAEGYLEAGWPAFWLGDFNAGPDPLMTCDPSSECPEPPDLANYDLVRQTFTDPNEGFPECTSCRDQFIPMAVIAIFNNEPDQRIDHCFHRGLETGVFVSGDRVFDEPQSIMIAGGETLEWLSDHYGMSCAFAGSP